MHTDRKSEIRQDAIIATLNTYKTSLLHRVGYCHSLEVATVMEQSVLNIHQWVVRRAVELDSEGAMSKDEIGNEGTNPLYEGKDQTIRSHSFENQEITHLSRSPQGISILSQNAFVIFCRHFNFVVNSEFRTFEHVSDVACCFNLTRVRASDVVNEWME